MTRQIERGAIPRWYPGTGDGITELTQDVLAGPGAGSIAATVAGLRGRPVGAAAPALGDVLTWNGAAWVPGAGGGGLQTLVDIDFTAQVPVDIKAGGPGVYTFGGVPFTVVNTNTCNRWDVTPGQGLCFEAYTPAGLFGQWPAMYVALPTLAANIDMMTQDTFFVAHIREGAVANTFTQYVLCGLTHDTIWNNAGPSTYANFAFGYSGAPFASAAAFGFGSDASSSVSPDVWDDSVQMLSMVGGGQTPQWASQPYTSFPGTRTARRRFSAAQPVTASSAFWSQAGTRFFMMMVAGGANDTLGAQFEILRLAVYGR